MRFILIAHGLIDRSGHHYMEARAFKEEAARHGLECTILANRDVSPSIRDELDAVPLFQHTPYQKFFRRKHFRSWRDFRFYGKLMGQELCSLPPGTISATDILVSPLTRARDMSGLTYWLARLPRSQHPFLALNFMFDDISRPVGANGGWKLNLKAAFLYRLAFLRLRHTLAPNRIHLSAGGVEFAKAMTRALDYPVVDFPLPVQHEIFMESPDIVRPDQAPCIAFLGFMHPRKGAKLAGAVISRVLAKNANCRFLLQANPEYWEKRWQDEIGPVASARVHIHRGAMTQDEYQNTMKMAELVLLPYPPAGYTLQTSGVFSEAMAMGKVSIVPEGTWMAANVRKYGGGAVMFSEFEVDSIAAACLRALEHLPSLKRDMRYISSHWRENMGMKTFVQRILDAGKACRT